VARARLQAFLFGGKPALSLMIDGGTYGLHQVRRLLDGRRGGWS